MKIIHGHNGRNYKFGNNNERKMYKPLNIYKYRKKSSSTTTCHTHAELARALESKIRKKKAQTPHNASAHRLDQSILDWPNDNQLCGQMPTKQHTSHIFAIC